MASNLGHNCEHGIISSCVSPSRFSLHSSYRTPLTPGRLDRVHNLLPKHFKVTQNHNLAVENRLTITVKKNVLYSNERMIVGSHTLSLGEIHANKNFFFHAIKRN